MKQDISVSGMVENGFQNVQNLFRQNLSDCYENCASLCVYFQGRKVVDLVGKRSTNKHANYHHDSIQVVFSSSKVVSAIVMAMLVDQGRLDYQDKVRDHWPEFEAAGEEGLTVADVLRHDAGLAAFRGIAGEKLPLRDFRADRLKENSIGKVIERQRPNMLKSPSGN